MKILIKYRVIIFILLSAVFGIMSLSRGMRADINGDYHIYWETGKNFISGNKLYTPGLVDGGFTYPPFAAMLFSLFSFFPFHVSAVLFSWLINFGLWVCSFLLIKKIYNLLYPQLNLTWPLMLSLLLSVTFYWHNFIWMNANLPVLCFTLLGIKYFIQKKFGLSYIFFLAGTFFKITPVIFLLFAALKRGPKDWPKIIALALPFVLIPMAIRGFATGVQDWSDYYQAFVAPFSKGQIDENIISLGIPAMIHKLNTGNQEAGFTAVLHLNAAALKNVILTIQILIFGGVTVKFIYDRYVLKQTEFSAADYSLIFLITLLLPGRVWAHHHVCTSFIFTCLFLFINNRMPLIFITIAACAVMSIVTKAVVGQWLTDALRYFTYDTWVMIFVAAMIVWFGYINKRRLHHAMEVK